MSTIGVSLVFGICDYIGTHATIDAGAILCAEYGKGHITQSFTVTSGTAADKPFPGSAYVIGSGGALKTLTKGLAIDMAPLRVNCISPGLVATEMLEVRCLFLRRAKPWLISISRLCCPNKKCAKRFTRALSTTSR
jgi:NAD(P)-dependent dehydrogenase (short-subunit alcohol dehydrogenase family)